MTDQTKLKRLRDAADAAWEAERVARGARDAARDEAREAADTAWEMDAAWVAAREAADAADAAWVAAQRKAAWEAGKPVVHSTAEV